MFCHPILYVDLLSLDPPEQDHVGLNMDAIISDSEAGIGLNMDQLLQDSEAQEGPDSLSFRLKVGFEVGLSGRTNHPFSRVVDLTFGQNRLETIYRLRILAVFNLVLHIITGIPYLQFLHGVHATYMVSLAFFNFFFNWDSFLRIFFCFVLYILTVSIIIIINIIIKL